MKHHESRVDEKKAGGGGGSLFRDETTRRGDIAFLAERQAAEREAFFGW